MRRFGLFLLVLLLLPVSALLNAASAIKWTFDGKPNDVDDDNVPGRSWEAGLRDYVGLTGPAVRKVLADLRSEPRRWNHHLKGVMHAWIREYPKRASKLGALLAVVVMAVWLGQLVSY